MARPVTQTMLTLHDPGMARHYYEEGLWQNDTFYSLAAARAKAAPAAPAVRDAARRLTYRELVAWTDGVAQALAEAGVRGGQRVSIWLPNRVEALVVLLACSRNGYVCNPSLHQNYTVAEVVRLLKRMSSAAVFAEVGYGVDAADQDVRGALASVDGLRRTFWLEPESRAGELGTAAEGAAEPGSDARGSAARSCAANLNDGQDRFPEAGECAAPPQTNPDKVLYLAFTSGTTGEPKGVMHSDNSLLANARCMVRDWHFGSDLVLYSLSPLSHHIGTVGIAQSLCAGGEIVLNAPPPGYSPLDWIVESGATYVMGVPTHAIDILAEQRRRGLTGLGQVKVFYMAGSPIPPETAQAFLDQGIVPQNIYGMTENSSHQYTLPTDNAHTIVGTCGRACDAYEVAIFDPDNRDEALVTGEVGEIGGRGACLMLGYFDNQSTTESSFNADGWFLSGDIGALDENGCLRILGRQKDLIIRGGHNIYPAEIEALAIKHPRVNKAAAIPMPDDRLGETVCLLVLTESAEPLPAMDVLSHLHDQGLSRYDMPEYFACMDAFPLTPSGKILKRVLAAQARNGQLTAEAVRWTGN